MDFGVGMDRNDVLPTTRRLELCMHQNEKDGGQDEGDTDAKDNNSKDTNENENDNYWHKEQNHG